MDLSKAGLLNDVVIVQQHFIDDVDLLARFYNVPSSELMGYMCDVLKIFCDKRSDDLLTRLS